MISETSTRSTLAYKSITHQAVFERANPSAKRPQTEYTLVLEQVTLNSEGEDTPSNLKKSDINVGIDETILEEEEATVVVKKPDLSFNIPAVPIKAEEGNHNTVVQTEWHYADKLMYMEHLKEYFVESDKAFGTHRFGSFEDMLKNVN